MFVSRDVNIACDDISRGILTKDLKLQQEGIDIFSKLMFNTPNLTAADKIIILNKFGELCPDDAMYLLCKIKDTIVFLKNEDRAESIALLVSIVKTSSWLSAMEKLLCATTIFYFNYFSDAHDCFEYIASSNPRDNFLVTLEAIKYLFSSENDRVKAFHCLATIIMDDEIPSKKKYDSIHEYTKGSIILFTSSKKIAVNDREFVYALYTIFLDNPNNGLRERILAAQYLLGMKELDKTQRDDITEFLFSVASNDALTENTRADSLDVIANTSLDKEVIEKSRKQMQWLGTTGSVAQPEVEVVKTIYDNSQNVHLFDNQLQALLYNTLPTWQDLDEKYQDFDYVLKKISEHVRVSITDPDQKLKIYSALHRISIDTATFTELNYDLKKILVHVWAVITKSPNKDDLIQRLFEELNEMDDTCSTGHSLRFLNVLSNGDDIMFKIDFKDQIFANVEGRLKAMIRDCSDEDIKDALSIANTEFADDEDNETYALFVKESLSNIYSEMREEFVIGNYISQEEFDEYFKIASSTW